MAEPPHDPSYRARSDAQTCADAARRETAAARAVVAASSGSSAEVREAARAALTASVIGLRTAVDALAVLHAQDGSTDTPRVDVERSSDGRTVTARPHGELDLLTCPHLERTAVAQLDDPAVEQLIMDLSDVTFLDSSALAVLVEVHHVATENQMLFTVTGLNRRQRRLLEITRLDQILHVV